MDERIERLAYNLVNASVKAQKGEHVLISVSGENTRDITRALVRQVYAAGGYPHVELHDAGINRELYLEARSEQIRTMNKYQLKKLKMMDAFISVNSSANSYELGDVPKENMLKLSKGLSEAVRYRVNRTKWVVTKFPNASMAQASRMSTEAFEDYYFTVCNFDYSKIAEALEPLKALMEKTDKVRITGKGTNLTFSIKGIPAVPCAGEANIPDGEIYTAPVRDSVNGVLSYNTTNQYQGTLFEDIVFTFKDGKIIRAESNDNDRINAILDTDKGARFIGEFALGVNPYITKPMLDTLFDEKICGSFHFTPGAAYEDAYNGNDSALHWDLVCIQTPEYGGGEIYFDDILIRKDGKFVLKELELLNPENLI